MTAAQAAIVLSVRVGNTLRNACGKKEDVLDLRPEIRRLFADEAERAEAHRLLDLVAWMRRNRRADEVSEAPLWEEVGE